jgi:hypothetical protein
MTTHGLRLAAVLTALTISLGALTAAGLAAHAPSKRTTFLLSSAHGGPPNGPSRNGAVSHDQRIARYMAYESDASNIVAGDTNGQTDVFLVSRAQPYGTNGTPWKAAGTSLISHGQGGQPANGASYLPTLDGDSHHAPHCLAFVSAASNLVRGDTNGKPDGFVYNIRSHRIRRVTVGSGGAQANGSTYGISITGDCNRVAFTSDATNLAGGKAVPSGRRQVYVQGVGGSGPTLLASAANSGAPGNGDSQDPAIARSGRAVVFASTATNLSRHDGSAASDVYRRTLVGGGGLSLVSAGASGQAGNAASSHPAISDDGRYIAYETDASNLLPGDTNGKSDIARADMGSGRPSQQWVTRTGIGGVSNGASHNPVISDGGEFVLFDSDASNLRPSRAVRLDANGVKDVFLWNARTGNVSLESRDANNGYLHTPSQHPATSSHGNYVTFESGNAPFGLAPATQPFPALPQQPQIQRVPLPRLPQLPGLPQLPTPHLPTPQLPAPGIPKLPGLSAAVSPATAGQQVYVRYLGPK